MRFCYHLGLIEILGYNRSLDMERVIQKYRSHEEARKKEQRLYRSLNSQDRLTLVEILRRRYHKVCHGDQQGFRRTARVFQRPSR